MWAYATVNGTMASEGTDDQTGGPGAYRLARPETPAGTAPWC